MLLERSHGVVYLLPLLLQVFFNVTPQLGVRNVMRAVGQAGEVAALQLVLTLSACLNSWQPPLYGRLQSLCTSIWTILCQ